MSERIRLLGLLQERKLKARGLALEIEGLRDSISSLMDKYLPLEQLKAELAARQAMLLAARQIEYIDLQTEIAAIKRDLGE